MSSLWHKQEARRVNIARSLDAAPPAREADAKRRLRSLWKCNKCAPGRNCTHECAFHAAAPRRARCDFGRVRPAGGQRGRKRRKPKALARSFTHSRCRADRSYYRKKRLSAFSRRKKEAPENRPLLVLVIGALTHTHAVAFESAPLVQQSAAGLAAIRDCCLTWGANRLLLYGGFLRRRLQIGRNFPLTMDMRVWNQELVLLPHNSFLIEF
jgi:hypothetical protein